MTAANKNFQRLKRRVQAIDAWKNSKDRDLEISDKFPYCRGTFDTCPTEKDLNSFLKKKSAPQRCGRCPIFQASNTKGIGVEPRQKTPEEIEELQKVFGKKK